MGRFVKPIAAEVRLSCGHASTIKVEGKYAVQRTIQQIIGTKTCPTCKSKYRLLIAVEPDAAPPTSWSITRVEDTTVRPFVDLLVVHTEFIAIDGTVLGTRAGGVVLS